MSRTRKRTPMEIAEAWYNEDEIDEAINARRVLYPRYDHVPEDVHSREFAVWLTRQYRLAMAKGIQLGRDGSED